ncbi:DUF2147 domain-containing protein [Blastomonas aquatica]|uniref:DUF2147 domain-containing protein n=2 Tax=Blastomonas aquatica TaxID=1510276 RepID=A0ABQ1JDG8_9SPHN|nr:hypothetical protein GCM10010833_19490 [Blastomonas aquatica]
MRLIASVAILAAGTLAFAMPAQAAENITGQWYTKDKRALVTIAPCGKALCGKIARLIEQPKSGATTDVNNPDPVLRKRKLVGLPILSGFVADGAKWRGQIYDPNTGKTYRSIVSNGKAGSLNVEGCVAMFCQTQIWTSAK